MIYAIRLGKKKQVKIGFSTIDGDFRARKLQTGTPDKLEVIAECWGSRRLESAIHEHLRRDRIVGEWFKLTPRTQEVIDAIKIGPEGAYLLVTGGSVEGYITEDESTRIRNEMNREGFMEYRGMLTGNRRIHSALNWGR